MTTPSAIQPLTAEDRLEIIDLLHRYMFVLDAGENHGNGYGYADLYTKDGTFRAVPSDNPPRQPGREGLAAAAGRAADGSYREDHKRGERNQVHLNIGEVIVPTAEGARGTSYILMIDGPANQIYWAGWYEDEYRKTPKGWRFKSRLHVQGPAAGIPDYAGPLRQEVHRMAMQSLEHRGELPPPSTEPLARDPLAWVDEG